MGYTRDEKNEICDKIFKKISVNGMALRNVLKIKGMPSSETFFRWIRADEEKAKQYARVCVVRADTIFEDILKIADNNTKDIIFENGKPRTNKDVIARSRLMVDARKWYLSKLIPKKYGDASKITLEGGDEKKPINVSFKD